MRVLIRVAYDGTAYHGWQLQPGEKTIESELNRSLQELFGEEIHVIGASRTDTGVHSLGTVAVFDTNSPMPAEKVMYAMNARLPEDIRVVESREVEATFHPRKKPCKKTYEYRIYCAPTENPLKRNYSLYSRYTYDIDRMREAAAYLVGEHDFKSFCNVHTTAESTVRTIYELSVNCAEAEDGSTTITIRVTGNGFLYNMVRIIAGTLLEVGRGRFEPSYVKEMLEKTDRREAGPTAPARGLTLVRYEYLPEEK